MHFSALPCVQHAHLIVLGYGHPNILRRMCIIKVLIMQFPPASEIISIFLITMSLFSVNMKGQVSHPSNITCKIIVWYI